MKRLLFILHICVCLLGRTAIAQHVTEKLPAMDADLEMTSVSGISSGGFMAAQIAAAYSSKFMGVGIIAAGPFYCAGLMRKGAHLTDAMAFCMTPVSAVVAPSGGEAFKKATEFAAAGTIDPVSGLRRQRAYVFSGENDKTVKTVVAQAVVAFYGAAGVTGDQIKYEPHKRAAHSIVTNNPDDLPCDAEESPYINNCDFMQSHRLLSHIYPDKAQPPRDGALTGKIVKFDQSEFIAGTRTSMDKNAYVYIPAYCEKNRCAVHVAFHGCQQGRSLIGDRFYNGTGYNEFADANGIIVLYPQARRSDMPPNPKGCWDFWGYSSENQNQPDFYTRNAPQMRAVMAMIARLGEKRP